MGYDIKKTESDYYVILFFSVITLIFNIYIAFLKCIPIYPDKLILLLCILVTSILVIFIPVKVIQSKHDTVEDYVDERIEFAVPEDQEVCLVDL